VKLHPGDILSEKFKGREVSRSIVLNRKHATRSQGRGDYEEYEMVLIWHEPEYWGTSAHVGKIWYIDGTSLLTGKDSLWKIIFESGLSWSEEEERC
jgi:hypothetical protein